MLPPCFMPTSEAGMLLARVHEGLTVNEADASVLVRLGLLSYSIGESAGSGFKLTEDGETALGRYVYAQLAGRS